MARWIWGLLLALAGGCARSDERWTQDLSSNDPFERALAALALAEIDPARGAELTPLLLEAVDRGVLRLGDPARRALQRVAPHATEALVTVLLVDPFATLERRAAIELALVAAGEPGARTLVAAARGSGVARAAALEPALIALGPAARAPLQEAARDADEPELAAWAGRILERIEAHGTNAR